MASTVIGAAHVINATAEVASAENSSALINTSVKSVSRKNATAHDSTAAAVELVSNKNNSASVFASDTADLKILRDFVSQLPPHAVKDLLSTGVCARCILRLFGIPTETLYSCSLLSEFSLCSLIDEIHIVREYEDSESVVCCTVCLGILQFMYRDDKEKLVKFDSVKEFSVSVGEVVRKEGHQFDSFSLEVSLPSIILENEHVALLYMRRKYGSEPCIQEKFLSERVSAKEALKFSLVNRLETTLNVKSTPSSFRIRLTYTHTETSKMIRNSVDKNAHAGKRQRQGEDFNIGVNLNDLSTTEADAVLERSFKQLQTHEVMERLKFPLEKANEECRFTILCYRTPIYFGGRYLKYSRNVSQTRWIIDDERMGEASVEEIIGNAILPLCQGDNYKFHAAGREDIDVRMLGSGRPFLVEIQNAHQIPSEIFIKELEAMINQSENNLVRVKNLKELGSQGWDLMREGEAEKQKQYAALVWISRPLEDADIQTLSQLREMPILQRTPVRVLHRRSPLEREKIIHWMKVERLTGSSQYFLLHLCTQAGTYIKEFVHGDLGRTNPSIGSILDCRAEILQLDVTDVKMDCFLTE